MDFFVSSTLSLKCHKMNQYKGWPGISWICMYRIMWESFQGLEIANSYWRSKRLMESILSWFPLTSFHGGLIFCSVTELANRQITRQSTYESIYSFQTLDEKKPGVGTDKNAGAACVTLFANNPGPQSELCFNSTLNTGDCVLTFISSASYWNSQPALSLNDSPLPPPCLAYCNWFQLEK